MQTKAYAKLQKCPYKYISALILPLGTRPTIPSRSRVALFLPMLYYAALRRHRQASHASHPHDTRQGKDGRTGQEADHKVPSASTGHGVWLTLAAAKYGSVLL